jgi:D-sedoheptulose 7-phosphate isomerase
LGNLRAEAVCVKGLQALQALQALLEPLQTELALSFAPAHSLLADALRDKHKVLTCGNGGSATQAAHFAAELIVRYLTDRPALAAISLTEPAVITAAGNDYGYSRVFARQVEALGQPGDVLVAFSTSGKSPNVREAIATAQHRGLRTLGISGGRMACDVDIYIPSTSTARIQECTLLIIHLLCEALDG